jgi:hypothetical protein
MRNLKRVLSLSLALVMILGLMIVGTGASAADFTDQDEIVNDDAVNTLVALNIIAGKDDGSYFDPTGIVTRGEMAKMITIALNGGSEPVLGTGTSFSDTANHWASSYIEYCVNLKIAAGRGNGTFDPNATVTATEAAKMLLVAMNYDPAVFGLTGDSWDIKTNTEANKAGLYEDLGGVSASAGLTRDNAAQMIYNAILANTMELGWNQNMATGEITQTYRQDGDSIFADKYNGIESEGTITDFSYDSDKDQWTYTLNITKTTEGVADVDNARTSFKSSEDFTDLFRLNAKVLWTVKKGDVVVYGIYDKDNTVMAEGVLGDLKEDKITDKQIKVGSTYYKTTEKHVDYYAFGADTKNADGMPEIKDTDNDDVPTLAAAYSMKLIDNTGDGKADIVVYVPFEVSKVTYVGKNSITLSPTVAGVDRDFEDIEIYDGVAKDDYVMIVKDDNSAKGIDTYTKLDVASGKVTKTSGNKATIDGTAYTVVGGVGDGKTVKLNGKYDAANVNGYVVLTNTVSSGFSIDDFAVVTAFEAKADELSDNPRAILLFADGSSKTVEYDKNKSNITAKGDFVTYEVDDSVYTLTKVDVTDEGFDDYDLAENSGTYAYSSSKGYGTIDGNKIADDAVIFRDKGNGKYTVVTGATLKATHAAPNVNFVFGEKDSSTGFVTVTVAYVKGAVAASTDAQYGYLLAAPAATLNDDEKAVYELQMWTADGKVTLLTNTDTAAAAENLEKGAVIAYTTSDGEIDSIGKDAEGTSIDIETAGVVGYNGTEIELVDVPTATPVAAGSSNVKADITDDTIIVYVNTDDVAGEEGGSVQLAHSNDDEEYFANVAYAVSNGDVLVLFVDVENNWFNADLT